MTVNCDALGEKPILISWSKDRLPFDPRMVDGRYDLITNRDGTTNNDQDGGNTKSGDQKNGLPVTSAQVKIKSADRRDSALFTCTASNKFGRAEYNLQVIVQGMFSSESGGMIIIIIIIIIIFCSFFPSVL